MVISITGVQKDTTGSAINVEEPKARKFAERAGLTIHVWHGTRTTVDFTTAITTLDALLTSLRPTEFNSSWIRTHAPRCYRFFQRNVRREYGGIDWDSVTVALDRKFQRLWRPSQARKPRKSYEDSSEIETILKKHPGKLYVFISPSDKNDQRLADRIGISFVRLAQRGNLLARRQLCELVRFTVDRWIERYETIARWCGHEEELQSQLTACIRRYRYTGSFLTYVFRTLEYAGRGIMPARVCSWNYRSEASALFS